MASLGPKNGPREPTLLPSLLLPFGAPYYRVRYPQGLRTISSIPNSTNSGRVGARGHRNPNCACSACKARRRREAAIAFAAGTGGPVGADLGSAKAEALNADLPIRIDETETPRAYVARWLQLRIEDPDINLHDSAKKLKTSKKLLQSAIQRAVEEGWLEFEDPLSKVEFEIVPKVLRNLNAWLDENDKQVTLETAKGVVFPIFRDAKGISDAPQTVLALKIEAPPEGAPAVIQGQIIGTPRKFSFP